MELDLDSLSGESEPSAAGLLVEVEALLRCVAEGVVVCDADGRIVRSNAAADAILGYGADDRRKPAAERLATGPYEWLAEDGRPLTAEESPANRAARHGETHRGIVLRMRSERGERWLVVSAAPLVVHGVRRGAVVSFSDVTAQHRAEEDLRRAEAHYRTLAENAPEVIARFDRQLRHVYVNEYGAKVYGLAASEVTGKTSAELGMPPEKVAFWKRHFEEVLATERQRTVEFEFDGPTFGKQSFSSLFVPERDETGAVVSILAITRDVTAAKRTEEALRQSEERYRSLFTNMTEGFALGEVICDEAGRPCDFRLVEMNEAFERQSGLERERARGRSIRGVLPHLEQSWIETYCGVALGAPPVRFEMYNRDLDRHFSVYCFSPARGRFAILFTDVTERRRAEQALHEANERLREADRRKDDFLGMLSHELRNPLAPIRNALFILDRADPAGPQAQRARQVATRQLAHITRLVDDLLDVTRIARGKIELRRSDLDLAALVRRTADDHRAVMQSRGLDLAVAIPPEALFVHGDETRLAQVLGNLLSNAAKFTPAGGRVTVSVRADGERAVVSVRDTGVGVDPQILPAMFEPFTQAKQTLARSEGGLGLGLALVKGLVTLHGGDVTATSEGNGRGTEFVVALPLAARAATGASTRDEDRGPAPHIRRVLVVDDNRDAAETLAQLVEMLGHEADVAFDGAAAIRLARERHPDLVLCDIGLPGMDGYEVARRLRSDAGSRVRLVALSGYAQPEDVAQAIEAGFDEHVAKPPDPARLALLLA